MSETIIALPRRNKRIVLVRRPEGLPQPNDFRLIETNDDDNNNDDDDDDDDNKDNDYVLLLKTLFVSIDPAMRGWISTAKSYLPPVKLGSIMRASTISKVIRSRSMKFPVGAIVRTEIVGNNNNNNNNNNTNTNTNLSSYASYLGVLGTTGLTAYFGLFNKGNPKPQDIILISGAAGATGSIVAQIAKHVVGCRKVIGTAGTDAKCKWLEENYIVDIAINYKKHKTTKSLSYAIRNASKKEGGIDIVFDNVGSTFLEAALSNLSSNGGARIVLCGAISQYNNNGSIVPSGPRNYMNLLVSRATMTGFVVFDYQKEYPNAIQNLIRWIQNGKIKHFKEDVHFGIENFYPALVSLFHGTNQGKVVLQVSNENNNNRDNDSNGRDNEHRSKL
ncbi:NAD(P)-binding protein [Fragilariopsis cylindrus CCMP1102]|uniref:NAD(P)-binding protein n=1 Tax=Fragilariopsis cylindrus CCMP1102 TaxID=635003 RepID=A0A1E7FNJ5_9STRA|nr:NAD(P)-binding protein [Fragilariopsis cylindrus CCMP1102]|eukprot:OEU19704.1 NAD(P)-binding protein [Fragilariopsis cylindrus CCMP1102]